MYSKIGIWNEKKGYAKSRNPLNSLAERTGLEPATPGVTGRYSNQLNYRSGYPTSQENLASPRGFEPLYPP